MDNISSLSGGDDREEDVSDLVVTPPTIVVLIMLLLVVMMKKNLSPVMTQLPVLILTMSMLLLISRFVNVGRTKLNWNKF